MISSSLEEYLKTIYVLKKQGQDIKVTTIANRMNCTKPSVNKAIKNSKSETGIDIPQEVKEYYKTFFGERYYELKSAYQEYLEKGTSEEKEENQAR